MTDPHTDSNLFAVIVENPPEGGGTIVEVAPGDKATDIERFPDPKSAENFIDSLHGWDVQKKLGRIRVYDYGTETVVFELER
jgi:hypothetical protein